MSWQQLALSYGLWAMGFVPKVSGIAPDIQPKCVACDTRNLIPDTQPLLI